MLFICIFFILFWDSSSMHPLPFIFFNHHRMINLTDKRGATWRTSQRHQYLKHINHFSFTLCWWHNYFWSELSLKIPSNEKYFRPLLYLYRNASEWGKVGSVDQWNTGRSGILVESVFSIFSTSFRWWTKLSWFCFKNKWLFIQGLVVSILKNPEKNLLLGSSMALQGR